MSSDIGIGSYVRIRYVNNKSMVGRIVNRERVIYEYENREGVLDNLKNLRIISSTKFIIRLSDNKIIKRGMYEFDIITKQQYFLEAL